MAEDDLYRPFSEPMACNPTISQHGWGIAQGAWVARITLAPEAERRAGFASVAGRPVRHRGALVRVVTEFLFKGHDGSLGAMLSDWSSGWFAVLSGNGCGMCADRGRVDNGFGVRYLQGRYADAYLQRSGQVRGYSHVIWRGRHVGEVTQLSAMEAAGFWLDVVDAARAVEAVFAPVKLNVSMLGNGLPHLHAHVIPRHGVGDPRPNRPLPHRYLDHGRQDESRIVRDAEALADFLAGAPRAGNGFPVV